MRNYSKARLTNRRVLPGRSMPGHWQNGSIDGALINRSMSRRCRMKIMRIEKAEMASNLAIIDASFMGK